MSFLSDLFEGNFGNLGTDISHAPSSLINHPDELAETLGGAALVAAPFVLPEVVGGLGALGGADAAAGAADLGAGDFLAGDAALAGDAGFTTEGLLSGAELDSLAAPFAGSAADVLAGGDAALSFAPDFGDALLPDASTLATGSIDIGGDATAAAGDATAGDAFAATAGPGAPSGPAGSVTGIGSTGTPAGFASTDAELTGGVTGSAAPSATTAGTGTSLTSALGSTLSSPWTKLAIAAAPLGLALARGESGLPSQANQAGGIAGQLGQQGLTDLASAKAGVLNAGQTATLGQMKSDLTNQWRQVLFNQGVQDPSKDTRWPQIEAQIDSQVTAQTQTMIQQNIQNALAETGQAQQTLTQIAQMQMQADANFTQTLVGATKALGTAVGGGTTIQLKAA